MNMDLILGLAGVSGAALGCMTLGWAARIFWVEKRDDKQLRAAEARYERHHHRKGDPVETTLLLPRAGRLPLGVMADPAELPTEAAWRFAGEPAEGWAAEYERLHQPEPLTDTGEMRALGDRVVAKLEGDTNEWIFANVLRTTT